MRRQKRQSIRQQQGEASQGEMLAVNALPPIEKNRPVNCELVGSNPPNVAFSWPASNATNCNGTIRDAEFDMSGISLPAEQAITTLPASCHISAHPLWPGECESSNNLDLDFDNLLANAIGLDSNERREGDSSRGNSSTSLEFSVTCSRDRLKAMVCAAFDTAMLEAENLPEKEAVTVTLRLNK